MATTVVLKRSARLRSRNQSITVLPEIKRKPKKVTTVNKSIQKVNVSARRLRPRQSKRNYCDDSTLLQKHVPTQQHESVVILEKLDIVQKKVPIYKTLKSEKSLEEKSDVYDFPFDPNDMKEKIKKKKRKLRKKNVNKTGNKVTKKSRVKKKIELSKREPTESGSKEREDVQINKIEAPRIDADVQTKKRESVKNDVEKIETDRIDTDIPAIEETIGNEDIVEPIVASGIKIDVQVVEESVKEDIVGEAGTSQTDSSIQSMGETNSEKTIANQNKKQDTKKPKIVSIENANNIVVTRTSPNKSKDLDVWPFRPKNIFDNKTSKGQSENTLNSSLLTKALSPIMKVSNYLDLGSPWRPPTFPVFSQAKHFVQSTPNVSMNNENIEEDKENLQVNKKSKYPKKKEKKKPVAFSKKPLIPREFPTDQNLNKIKTVPASKTVEQPAPSRISLRKIRTLFQKKPNNDRDNKQVMNETQTETDKSPVMQRDKQLANYLNFSDTFDVMSESERLSNIEPAPLFVDLEPSYFSKPPQHSYKRKRCVKFDFLEDDEEDGEEKHVETHMKKKKLTKPEKEHQKEMNDWVKSINSTFEEIDNYNLLIE
ncbi:hypothetical protein DMN91_009534 [Ooceraea biroi]|uniref:Uncharacterized protein n=1 Tax=Ooceraea biroi TaxID=2015173 RepID=A0A3L8DAF2_OOCBI|nr:uncharacterized protein LOC105280551 [Ooceraea biroi]XP_026828882.1 uncharacterized protein LOC105280551 [Ooceraea biroi]RLU17301.1 hypothetical protein DMN91_009534 [Ooceraea biroi]